MTKKYPCNSCKALHRRGALVEIHKKLLCRKCMLLEYPTNPINPIKDDSRPLKTPLKDKSTGGRE